MIRTRCIMHRTLPLLFMCVTFQELLRLAMCVEQQRATSSLFPLRRKFVSLPGYLKNLNNDGKQTTTNQNIKQQGLSLRVQQFNVLADGLAGLRPDLGKFSRASKTILDWENRKDLLLREITQYDPDILTLQECDHYYDFFLPQLSAIDYTGYFAPKPTSACLEVSDNSDGCALFIKNSKLHVVSVETKTLALSIAELGEGGEVQEDGNDIKAQNQVAMIVVCDIPSLDDEEAANLPPIIICTTHLKSSKTATGERYRQKGIQQILKQIQQIYKCLEDGGRSPAVLLTGVFNAEPRQTQGYNPLTYKAVKAHQLGFRSVYNDDVALSHVKLSSKDIYTTWKARAEGQERITKRCIDYIFYSTFREGIMKNSEADLYRKNRPKVTAFSTSQVAIAFFMRSVVYIIGMVIPISSFYSTSLASSERLIIFFLSFLGFILFEQISDGSIFKPRLDANIDTNGKPFDDDREAVGLLDSVGRLSQKIEPLKLKQYGRPGFQAVSALDLFGEEEIGDEFFPSDKYPSDHVSIVSDLQLLF